MYDLLPRGKLRWMHFQFAKGASFVMHSPYSSTFTAAKHYCYDHNETRKGGLWALLHGDLSRDAQTMGGGNLEKRKKKTTLRLPFEVGLTESLASKSLLSHLETSGDKSLATLSTDVQDVKHCICPKQNGISPWQAPPFPRSPIFDGGIHLDLAT